MHALAAAAEATLAYVEAERAKARTVVPLPSLRLSTHGGDSPKEYGQKPGQLHADDGAGISVSCRFTERIAAAR
jgi:hypothetical protein